MEPDESGLPPDILRALDRLNQVEPERWTKAGLSRMAVSRAVLVMAANYGKPAPRNTLTVNFNYQQVSDLTGIRDWKKTIPKALTAIPWLTRVSRGNSVARRNSFYEIALSACEDSIGAISTPQYKKTINALEDVKSNLDLLPSRVEIAPNSGGAPEEDDDAPRFPLIFSGRDDDDEDDLLPVTPPCCPVPEHGPLPLHPVHPIFKDVGGLISWALVERLIAMPHREPVRLPRHLDRLALRLFSLGIVKAMPLAGAPAQRGWTADPQDYDALLPHVKDF
jgi:hypothetical protein